MGFPCCNLLLTAYMYTDTAISAKSANISLNGPFISVHLITSGICEEFLRATMSPTWQNKSSNVDVAMLLH